VRLARRGRHEVQAVGARLLAEAPAEAGDVAVEVHRLVRLAREVRVALALEAGELGAEQGRQTAVGAVDLGRGELRGRAVRVAAEGAARARQCWAAGGRGRPATALAGLLTAGEARVAELEREWRAERR
jgi:hypothetical protein